MAKKQQVVSETEKPVRTRTLGELRWFARLDPERHEIEVIQDQPAFPDVLAADTWLKKELAEQTVTPGVFELHRVVKRVEPRRVEVLRFEW